MRAGGTQQGGFRVLVNDVECTAEDVDGEKHEFDVEVEGLGRVNGFYVIALSRQPNPGLAVRVRSRVVQEPSLFGLDTRTHGFFTAEKIIGEMNADFLDPENPAPDSRDFINTARNGFLEDAPPVYVELLEFHAWHSRTAAGPDAKDAQLDFQSSRHALEESVLNLPDYLVCDLDPYIYSGAEPAGAQPAFNAGAFARCKEVAFSLKKLVDLMRLQSVLKMPGKTGLHILVPIERTVTFEAARAVAHEIGKHLVAKHPELVTIDQRVSQRTGKIFFDYGMNAA
jgi:hypothetical protein